MTTRRRRRELEKVLRELEFRMAVTTAILSTLDEDYILYVILSGITAGDGLGFNRAFLFLDDEEARSLRVTLAVGPPSAEEARRIWDAIEREKIHFNDLLPRYDAFREDKDSQVLTGKLSSFELPLNRLEAVAASSHDLILRSEAPLVAVLARCLINGGPFFTNALTLRHPVGGATGEILEFRNVAIAPLSLEKRLIGAIVTDNYFSGRLVNSTALRSLQALGNLAALAIDRARMHARTVAMAEVDGLTGVYNRRYYYEALNSALGARRSGQPLSIAIFDLDHFKRYNDEHGHLVGDEVLKDVGRLLRQSVRASDVVARYGGEEFVILLKDTPRSAAVQVAEKLCQVVKQSTLASGAVAGLTLSAGVASAEQDETAEQLFDRADRALYAAKEAGRDRVVAAPE